MPSRGIHPRGFVKHLRIVLSMAALLLAIVSISRIGAGPAVSSRTSSELPVSRSPAKGSTGLGAPDPVVNLKSVDAVSNRRAEIPRDRQTLSSTTGPPPLTDFSSTLSSGSALSDPTPAVDREFFAAKYASFGAEARKRARATLDALFLAHKSGEETKDNALTDEQAAALEREILWLDENPGR
jgi:hypothetical protein